MSEHPYAEGWRQWDERYADLVIGKRNWQITAGGLLVLNLILRHGLARQPEPIRSLRGRGGQARLRAGRAVAAETFG